MNRSVKENRKKILAMRSVMEVMARSQKKEGVRLSSSDIKEIIKDKGIVERIYITRGDGEVNESGVKCDKFAGLLINEGIYWIEGKFGLVAELAETLHPLGIGLTPHGSYGTWGWGDEREMMFDSALTKVGETQESMFEEGSRWLENTVWAVQSEAEQRMFWTIPELQKELLKIEKEKDKAIAKENAAFWAEKDKKKVNNQAKVKG